MDKKKPKRKTFVAKIDLTAVLPQTGSKQK